MASSLTSSTDRTLAAKLAAEAVGTFALVYVGVMVLVLVPDANPSKLTVTALAHGLVIAVMASATMVISGAHLNPAVTAAMWAGRRIPGAEAASYVMAQLAGGAAGALLAKLSLPEALQASSSFATGVPALSNDPTYLVSPATAVVIEAILTFFLVFVVFGTGVDARFGARVGGLAIGFAVAVGVLAGGMLTGAAMNPARWFGPALAANQWQNAAVWIVGPLLGAVAASALWTGLLMPKAAPRTPTEPSP